MPQVPVQPSQIAQIIRSKSESGGYTLVAADAGWVVRITSAGGVTIPAGIIPANSAITIINETAAAFTITMASGVTCYFGALTGNRTLGARGLVTIYCSSLNNFYIPGGLT